MRIPVHAVIIDIYRHRMKRLLRGFSFFWRHKIFIIVISCLLAGGAYYFFSNRQSTQNESSSYKTALVGKSDIRSSVTGSGQVSAKEQVDLKPVAAGDAIEVLRVAVKNDQEVKKGDLVAVLDTSDAEQSIRDAELSVKSVSLQKKKTNLTNRGDSKLATLTRQAQQVSYEQAVAKLDDARLKLQDYYIRAPFDGIVTGLDVSAGDSVSRTDILASVITREMYAKVTLNEVDAANVRIGQPVDLTFSALNAHSVTGTVAKVDTIGTVQQNVVSYDVEVSFDSNIENLKPGMSVDVEIVTAQKKGVLTVPNEAVKSDDEGQYVLAAKTTNESPGASSEVGASQKRRTRESRIGSDAANQGDRRLDVAESGADVSDFRKIRVETGISNEIVTEIRSGLQEGDTIVTSVASTANSTSAAAKASQSNSRGGSSLFPFGGSGRR